MDLVYNMRLVYVLTAIGVYGQVFAASRGYVEMPLRRSADSMYYVEDVTVGKSKQKMKNVILDTGSADLVLTGSTYKYKGPQGPHYVSQYGSSEPFGMFEHTDSVTGPGWTLKQTILGVANVSNIDSFYGVFGIGYTSIEAMDSYDNFPVKLESQGLTASQVYSISGGTAPEIVFGGVDVGAYTGPLVKTPIGFEVGPHATRQYHTVTAVTVNLVVLTGPNTWSRVPKTPISIQKLLYTLDTGSNALMVPEPVYDNLIAGLHAKKYWKGSTPYFYSPALSQQSLVFNITGYTVSVPVSDLIDDCVAVRGAQYCSLMVGTVDIGVDSYVATIPNSLFRYVYTVFDLHSNYVYMAPYLGARGQSISAVSGTILPVPTTTAPAYNDLYTVMYDAAAETTLTTASPTARCRH